MGVVHDHHNLILESKFKMKNCGWVVNTFINLIELEIPSTDYYSLILMIASPSVSNK